MHVIVRYGLKMFACTVIEAVLCFRVYSSIYSITYPALSLVFIPHLVYYLFNA